MLRCLLLYAVVVGVYSGCVDDITEPLPPSASNASTIQFVIEGFERSKNARRSLESSVATESPLGNSAHHTEQRTPSRAKGEMLHDTAPSLSLKPIQPPSNRTNNPGTLDLKALDALIKKPSATDPKIEERRKPSAPEFELEEEMEPKRIARKPKAPEADSEDVFETSTRLEDPKISSNEIELASGTNETPSVQLADQPEVPAEIPQPPVEQDQITSDQMTNKSDVQPEVQEIAQQIATVNASSFSTAAETIPDYYVEEASVEDWERAVLSGTYPDPVEAPPTEVEGSGEDLTEEEASSPSPLVETTEERQDDNATTDDTKSDTATPAEEQVQQDQGEAVAETEQEPTNETDETISSKGEEKPPVQTETQEIVQQDEPKELEELQQQDVLADPSVFSIAAETIPDYYVEDKSLEDWERAVLSGTNPDPTEMPPVEEGSGEVFIAEQLSPLEQKETAEMQPAEETTATSTATPAEEQIQQDRGEAVQEEQDVQSSSPVHITMFEETVQETEASGVSETKTEETLSNQEGSGEIEDSPTFNDIFEAVIVKSSEETKSNGTAEEPAQQLDKEEKNLEKISETSEQRDLDDDIKSALTTTEVEAETETEVVTSEAALLEDQPYMTSSSASPKEEEEEEEEVSPSSSEAPGTAKTIVAAINVKSAEEASLNAEQFSEEDLNKIELSERSEQPALENIEEVTDQAETTSPAEALKAIEPLIAEATSTPSTRFEKQEVLQVSTDTPIQSSTEEESARITSSESIIEQKDFGEAVPTTSEPESTSQSTTEDLPPSTTTDAKTEAITTEITTETTTPLPTTARKEVTVPTTTESSTPTTTTEISTTKKEELKDRAADFVTTWTRRPRKKRCPRATNYREYEGQCYSIWSYEPLQQVSVEKAEEACGEARPGAKLVSIHSKEEQNIVTELQHTIPHPHETLIGLRYNSRAFSWSDGTPMHYLHNRLQTKRTSYCVVNDIHCKKDDCSAQWKLVSCNNKYWYFVCKHETI